MFSTHFDCVPPFFPTQRRGTAGSTAAARAMRKGILAAQVAAAERLRASGERRVGLLFVVGEERGSDGAALANASPRASRFLVNGEPTDNRLATATRGVLRIRLHARGRAATPRARARRVGDRQADRRADPAADDAAARRPASMGATFYTIGLIEGGVAPNVISPHASAEIVFRHRRPRRRCAGGHRAAGVHRGDRGSAAGAAGGAAHASPGFDSAAFSVHHRCSAARALGHAAALRARLDPRRAHRRGAARSRGDGGEPSTFTSGSRASSSSTLRTPRTPRTSSMP